MPGESENVIALILGLLIAAAMFLGFFLLVWLIWLIQWLFA